MNARAGLTGLAVALLAGSAIGCDDDDDGSSPDAGLVIVPAPRAEAGQGCRPRQLAAGPAHTCAALDDGSLFCWGSNEGGALGAAAPAAGSPKPVHVEEVARSVAEVATGGSLTCVRRVDGSVACWGSVSVDAGPMVVGAPTRVALPGNAAQITVGAAHACALLADRRIACWGRGGALGDGTPYDRETATLVLGAGTSFLPATVSAGGARTCALDFEGRVHCWGEALAGLVEADAGGESLTPALAVGLPSDVDALRVGAGIVCVRQTSGDITCRSPGRESETLPDPQPVALRVAGRFACLVRSNGELLCFGEGVPGRPGRVPAAQAARFVLPEAEPAEAIAVGDRHVCAIGSSGRVFCFGANEAGQLGDGTMIDRTEPAPALLPSACP